MAMILVLVSPTLFGQAVETEGAGIEFSFTTYDYGEIEQGNPGTCEFTFTNIGTAPLQLTSVKTSCGCLVPRWPKEKIPPGASETILLKYDTRYRIGPFHKTAMVRSNAVNEPIVILKIKGTVLKAEPPPPPIKKTEGPQIKFEKLAHDFDTLDLGERAVAEYAFTNTGNRDLIITDAQGTSMSVHPTYPREPIPPGASGVITVEYKTQSIGPFQQYVTVFSNANGSSRRINLVFKGRVVTKLAPEK